MYNNKGDTTLLYPEIKEQRVMYNYMVN